MRSPRRHTTTLLRNFFCGVWRLRNVSDSVAMRTKVAQVSRWSHCNKKTNKRTLAFYKGIDRYIDRLSGQRLERQCNCVEELLHAVLLSVPVVLDCYYGIYCYVSLLYDDYLLQNLHFGLRCWSISFAPPSANLLFPLTETGCSHR